MESKRKVGRPEANNVPIHIRVNKDDLKILQDLAEQEDRSLPGKISLIVKNYVKDLKSRR